MWTRIDSQSYQIVRSIPLETDCSVIYILVEKVIDLSMDRFFLSNGTKILSPGHPLRLYLTSATTSHGLHLDCCLRCPEGDGSDDEGENWECSLSPKQSKSNTHNHSYIHFVSVPYITLLT